MEAQKEDDFKTDDDEEMEVDKQAPQKRKKVRRLNSHSTVFTPIVLRGLPHKQV